MSAIEMKFMVNGTADNENGCSDVRIWLDSELTSGLGSERELPLQYCDRNSWTASFVINDESSDCFMYRIGVRAEPGAVWSLEVRQAGDSGRSLLVDSDTVVMPKEWLVGTCAS